MFLIFGIEITIKILEFCTNGASTKARSTAPRILFFLFYSKKRTNLMVVRPILPVVELLVSIEGASRLIERILGLEVSK